MKLSEFLLFHNTHIWLSCRKDHQDSAATYLAHIPHLQTRTQRTQQTIAGSGATAEAAVIDFVRSWNEAVPMRDIQIMFNGTPHIKIYLELDS